MRIKNFLFHRVTDETDAQWPPMKTSLFRKTIGYLKKHYEVVQLEALLADPDSFARLKKPLATVLFDDGYKDNIEYAAPILKQFNCKASFYVVTDCIDRNIPTWTYIVDFVVDKTERHAIEIPFPFAPENLRSIKPGSANGKLKFWMKTLPNNQRNQVMEVLIGQLEGIELPRNMMSWDEVKQLQTEGFTIGSHSHTHPMLARLETEAEIREELDLSLKKIQEKLAIHPLTISYPIGSFDERVKRISAEVGYRYGLAVEQEFFDLQRDDLMSIPRVELYQEPWWKVATRINGIYNRARKLWK